MNTPNNTYWTTKDGKRLLITDMDIDHVKHCVALVTRQLGHQFINYDYCPRVRLCELLTAANQEATLASLTDPNY